MKPTGRIMRPVKRIASAEVSTLKKCARDAGSDDFIEPRSVFIDTHYVFIDTHYVLIDTHYVFIYGSNDFIARSNEFIDQANVSSHEPDRLHANIGALRDDRYALHDQLSALRDESVHTTSQPARLNAIDNDFMSSGFGSLRRVGDASVTSHD